MKISDLIEALAKFPPTSEVKFYYEGGTCSADDASVYESETDDITVVVDLG